jgi:hypothetical protein
MTPKATRRPRKLLLTIALIAALLFCILPIVTLFTLRASLPASFFFGTTLVYVDNPTDQAFSIDMYESAPGLTEIVIKRAVTTGIQTSLHCQSRSSEFSIFDITFITWDCHP